jgi:hypothetical protein
MKTKPDYISPEDWKFMEQNPYGDDDFSEEHNKRVIKEVNDHNDKMDRKRKRDYKVKTQERTDAVARYLKNISQGKSVSSVDKYFGKRHLAYLRGVEVANQLKMNPAILNKLKGVKN